MKVEKVTLYFVKYDFSQSEDSVYHYYLDKEKMEESVKFLRSDRVPYIKYGAVPGICVCSGKQKKYFLQEVRVDTESLPEYHDRCTREKAELLASATKKVKANLTKEEMQALGIKLPLLEQEQDGTV